VKNIMDNEETTLTIEPIEENNAGCQVRRKIEDLLERRRTRDELGDFDELLGM
jgi:hypothetical protein